MFDLHRQQKNEEKHTQEKQTKKEYKKLKKYHNEYKKNKGNGICEEELHNG